MRYSAITKRLTVIYIIALVMIGSLTLVSDAILISAVEQESAVATTVNLSGRQRMLSQRIALMASEYVQYGGDEYRDVLLKTTDEMMRNHITLTEGDPEIDITLPTSDKAQAIYYSEPHEVDRRVRGHFAHVQSLTELDDPRTEVGLGILSAITDEARGPLLAALDAAVMNYEREARERIDAIERVNAVVISLLFIVLVAVGVFLFRPMVNRIQIFIDDRNEKEATLRRMSWVLENMADAMILTDVNGRIITCNKSAQDLTGYSKEELVGSPVIDLVVLDTFQERSDMQTEARKSVDDGGVWRGEFQIKRKDGAIRVFDNTTTGLLDESGNALGRVSINRDVTERFEVDRMKNEFVSVVSHELRTPLTSIMGSLGLIQSGAVGDIGDEVGSMIDIAYNNSDRLVRLINDILDIEKIEAGRMDFRSDRIEVMPLVEQAVSENAGFTKNRDVTLELKVPTDLDLWVLADKDKISQVFSNLLSNAIKFSPEGGRVEIAYEAEEDFVTFTVTDEGGGVPPEFVDHLFERFTQADASATRQKGGTGLGLTICKAIVDRMGGEIGLHNTPGQGAQFYFTVPRTASIKPILARPSDSRHALIIEDDADTATLLRLILKQIGLETDVTYSLDDARRQLESVTYDVITLDLAVNDENGLDLFKEIRAQKIDTPVIVVSGTGSEDDDVFDGGVLDFAAWIQKPLDTTQLQDTLLHVVRGNSGKPNVMHIEDDADVIKVVHGVLGDTANITAASTVAEAQVLLKDLSQTFDLILLDLGLPDGRGEDLLADLQSSGMTQTPVIVFSGYDVNADDIADSVVSVLEKSRTSNEELKECVLSALNRVRTPSEKTVEIA